MAEHKSADDPQILVEFEPRPGLQQVSLSAQDIAERSQKALDSAMGTINQMASRVRTVVDGLAKPPQKIEVAFGIKLDAEAGAIISKLGMEASITVKLGWEAASGGG